MTIKRVCVYCASSRKCAAEYLDAAEAVGRALARAGIEIVYGGGGVGLMGRLAEGALAERGRVTGVLPRFMDELEWGDRRVTELIVVDGMHERKRRMLEGADAVVALPGGCGTLEELLEAVTWKRLSLFLGPIVLVNTRGFFEPLLEQLERSIAEHFMDPRHRQMWSVVNSPEQVVEAIEHATPWLKANRSFAAL